MYIHLPTLYAVTSFATTVSGIFLLFAWSQERKSTTLAWWGVGLIVATLGGALVVLRGLIPDAISIILGNSLWLFAFGLMWCGARAFAQRQTYPLVAVAAALVWVAACQVDAFYADMTLRVRLASALVSLLCGLIAWEYGRGRDREMVSVLPAIVLLSVYAAFFAVRTVIAEVMPFPVATSVDSGSWISLGAAGLLAHNFCMAFLVMSMAKERVELSHRRAARIDPLTGIANRRAFFERGEPVLRAAARDCRPAALLVLDLDLFKRINDTYGHQTGDRVLCAFADTASALMRPGDLFGRLGGEEFACLLPGAGAAEATAVAERIRAQFAGRKAGAEAGQVSTVSIGVATTADGGDDLAGLLARADGALYRAKANGRNRVEWATAAAAPVDWTPANAAA